MFLAYYVGYTVYLILRATEHDALATFSLAMGTVVLPLTVVTLVLFLYRQWRAGYGEARD